MPPFREGPIEVDPRFDGEALHELRDIGHGHRVNIVDRSYDIPRGARTIKFPGSSADALLGIVRLVPLEEGSIVEYMRPDATIETAIEGSNSVNFAARSAFRDAAEVLVKQPRRIGINLYPLYRKDEDESAQNSGDPGFYTVANSGDERHLFVRTIDDLPFACASLVVGHSQRTEQPQSTGPFHGQRTP
jgi:L-fucose mutarotase/ribose pyranase (RbsD/FucU family)